MKRVLSTALIFSLLTNFAFAHGEPEGDHSAPPINITIENNIDNSSNNSNTNQLDVDVDTVHVTEESNTSKKVVEEVDNGYSSSVPVGISEDDLRIFAASNDTLSDEELRLKYETTLILIEKLKYEFDRHVRKETLAENFGALFITSSVILGFVDLLVVLPMSESAKTPKNVLIVAGALMGAGIIANMTSGGHRVEADRVLRELDRQEKIAKIILEQISER